VLIALLLRPWRRTLLRTLLAHLCIFWPRLRCPQRHGSRYGRKSNRFCTSGGELL